MAKGSNRARRAKGCVMGAGGAVKSHCWVSLFVLCGCFIKDNIFKRLSRLSSQSLGRDPLIQGDCLGLETRSVRQGPCATRLTAIVTLYLECSNLDICEMSSPFSLYTGDDCVPSSRPLLSPQCVPGPRLVQRAGEDGRRCLLSGAHGPWGTQRKTT